MTAVFVNGNPETGAIWDLLLDRLDRTDVLRLSPPGFGSPIPDGFDCSVVGYRDWLITELQAQPQPVDLVGHDVGGSTVIAVAMSRPDLIRSWVSDSVGVFDPDYQWHALARQWQMSGTGKESLGELLGGSLTDRVQRMVALGIPRTVAEQIAPAQGADMTRAILSFYRSAAQPVMSNLGRDLPMAAARPGLAIIGSADQFVGTEEMRRRSAIRAGSRPQLFEGLGHWWMVQDPDRAARSLAEFWADVATV